MTVPISNRIAFATVMCVLVLIAGAMGWRLGARFGGECASRTLPVLGTAPDFRALTNQLGQSVDSSRFHGKVQVVTFLFPYCTTYCPLIAAHLVGLENVLKLAGVQNRVAIVAYNVDPAGAGPSALRAFLKEYGWNPQDTHWEYLTGAPRAIRRVVTQGYHIAYQKFSNSDPSAPHDAEFPPQPEVVNPLANEVKPGYDVTHNNVLVIVDSQGRIRKFYAQADVISNEHLMRVIKALLPPRA